MTVHEEQGHHPLPDDALDGHEALEELHGPATRTIGLAPHVHKEGGSAPPEDSFRPPSSRHPEGEDPSFRRIISISISRTHRHGMKMAKIKNPGSLLPKREDVRSRNHLDNLKPRLQDGIRPTCSGAPTLVARGAAWTRIPLLLQDLHSRKELSLHEQRKPGP